jgi:hypothetical protein
MSEEPVIFDRLYLYYLKANNCGGYQMTEETTSLRNRTQAQ